MADARALVNIQQACEIAGVSRRTIYNWMKSGKLAGVRTAGGRVRIYSDSLFRNHETLSKGPLTFDAHQPHTTT